MSNEKYASFLEGIPTIYLQGLFEASNTAKHRIGTKRILSDGREFVYCQAGANINAGQLCQMPVHEANHANCNIPTAANAGDYQVTVTLGDADLTANAYAEGFLHINTPLANGGGRMYKIKAHPAANANANVTVTLYDKLRTALAANTSKATLSPHPCKGVIKHPSPPTGALVGVAPANITANQYFWCQCKGPAAVLIDGTVVAGDRVYPSAAVDGAVMPSSGNAADMVKEQAVGHVITVDANQHYGLVDLKL